MKLAPIKTIAKDVLAKSGELPKWIDTFLQSLNPFIEQVAQALQGQLTFEHNMLCNVVKKNMVHDVELEVNPYPSSRAKNLRVTGVILTAANGLGVDVFKWRYADNGNIKVTASFTGGTEAQCTLIILLGD